MVCDQRQLVEWAEIAKVAVQVAGASLSADSDKLRAIEGRDGREWKILADRRVEEGLSGNLRDKADFSILSAVCCEVTGISTI